MAHARMIDDGRRWCPSAASSSHASKGRVLGACCPWHSETGLLRHGCVAVMFTSLRVRRYIRRRHKPQMAPACNSLLVGTSTGEPHKQGPMCGEDAADLCDRKLPPVPDVNGQRWCRACRAMLPVSAFPTGKRRYLCRQHLWQRCTRPCKQRRLSDANLSLQHPIIHPAV